MKRFRKILHARYSIVQTCLLETEEIKIPWFPTLALGDTDEVLALPLHEDDNGLGQPGVSVVGESDPSAVIYRCPLCAFTSGSREYLISRHIKVSCLR